jgi:hypothetical protein
VRICSSTLGCQAVTPLSGAKIFSITVIPPGTKKDSALAMDFMGHLSAFIVDDVKLFVSPVKAIVNEFIKQVKKTG